MSALRGLVTSFMRTRRRGPGAGAPGGMAGPRRAGGAAPRQRQDAMIGRQVRKFLKF